MGQAMFEMGYDFLESLLQLPEKSQIVHVTANPTKGTFYVFVRHPELPEAESGNPWVRCCPIIEQKYSTDAPKFVSWGLEEDAV